MTPPSKAWVSPEAWACLFLGPHDQEAGREEADGGQFAPALPLLEAAGRSRFKSATPPPRHTV